MSGPVADTEESELTVFDHAPLLTSDTRQPGAGTAVSVTNVPCGKLVVSDVPVVPIEIPAGVEATVPIPVLFTISSRVVVGIGSKITEAVRAALIATGQLADAGETALQAPPHSAMRWPLDGVAASVTCVPEAKLAVSDVPPVAIEMPAGFDVTMPDPVLFTVRSCGGAGIASNVTVASELRFSVHVHVVVVCGVELQTPPQLAIR